MILGISLGVYLIFYAYLVEPVWLKVRTVPITISNADHRPLQKNLRIVHISDLHWGEFVSHKYLTDAFKVVAAQKPDLVLMTGDYVAWRLIMREDYKKALEVFSRAYPTYAVPGNHDGGEWSGPGGGYYNTDSIAEFMTSAGIHYLQNEYACPEIKSMKICIGGLGDLTGGFTHPEMFVDEYDKTPADLHIMLLHNPDAKVSVKDNKWDLMLAGHTHGGQVTLPVIGSPWVRVQNTKEVRGLFTYTGRPLHITPGVGSSQRRLRLNCRPEISVLEVAL
jgi:predicted MPP superfamily phosphohydrolase